MKGDRRLGTSDWKSGHLKLLAAIEGWQKGLHLALQKRLKSRRQAAFKVLHQRRSRVLTATKKTES